jgi:phospholipase A1
MILIFLFSLADAVSAKTPDFRFSPQDCSQIEDDDARLECYDQIFGRDPELSEPAPAEEDEKPSLEDDSYLARLWELDGAEFRGKFAIRMHRPNYILPASYNSSLRGSRFKDGDSSMDLKETEVQYQISIKSKLWQDVLGKKMDLWFGYTQRSFWQLYTFENSSPFRETNYEPEVLLNFRTDFEVLGLRSRMINIGFNHQSNGRSEPTSRSWNRIVGNMGFEKGPFVLMLNTWCRIPESDEDDDNPNIDDYLGPGEIQGYYFWNRQRLGLMLRNNLDFDGSRGAVQLEWSFPLIERIGGYIQYFNGYGENLLDYDQSSNRIGIGFILMDWD